MILQQKKVFTLFTVLVVCLIGLLIVITVAISTSNNQKETLIGVALEVTAPFSTSKLIISEDGSVQYTAQQSNQPATSETYKAGTFSNPTLNELRDLLTANNFFNLRNQPRQNQDPTDGSTYSLTVSVRPAGDPALVDAAIHTVTCYQPNCDQQFLVIKQFIINAFGKDLLEIGV